MIIGQVIERAIYIEISVVTDEHPGLAGHSADDDCALIVPVHRLNDTLFRSPYGENYFGPPIWEPRARIARLSIVALTVGIYCLLTLPLVGPGSVRIAANRLTGQGLER